MNQERALVLTIRAVFSALVDEDQPAVPVRPARRRRSLAKAPPQPAPTLLEAPPDDKLGKPDLGPLPLDKIFGLSEIRRQSPPPPKTYMPDGMVDEDAPNQLINH